MREFLIKRIVLEQEAFRYSFTDRILNGLSGVPVQSVSTEPKPDSHEICMGKETLCLLSHKGEFLKPCPGTKEYICCGYQILNVATNCPLDCSYCILQSYFNQPNLRVFVNLEEEIDQVMHTIDSEPDRIFRIGTGEFTDSLAIDPITHWSDMLLPRFSKRKNAVLELKTKTTKIDRLLASEYRDRIIVSWSLNSPSMASKEEHGAPSIKKRLQAARRCQSEGFVLGFHFDPLIHYRGWQEEYLKALELIDKYIDPEGIIWISLGSFRFVPGLKEILRRRHPGTSVLNGEFIVGLDGKRRYFKPIRIDLYSFMKENIDKWHRNLGIYLCMESNDVWQKALSWSPENSEGLRRYLDRRVTKVFG
jgi:spore photoproduct lyase